MVYSYDEKHKKLKSVKIPSLKGSMAERVKNAKVPNTFLNKVIDMKLNITSN